MNKIVSNLYCYGYKREYDVVEVPMSNSPSCYLTDPSYYVPSSEANKIQSTYDNFNGAYDDGIPDARIVDLRRPGNDITEVNEIVQTLKDDFNSQSAKALDEATVIDKANADKKAVDDAQTNFINNLMANSSDNH